MHIRIEYTTTTLTDFRMNKKNTPSHLNEKMQQQQQEKKELFTYEIYFKKV